MTKEEIKRYLMNMHEAINALEKELCDDISEDGTLTVNVEDGSMVKRVLVCGDNHFGGLYYPEQESCENIEDLSPGTSAEKVGQWIYDKLRYWNGGCKYECSECGMGSNMNYAYCMRCGCKMQEREE